MKPIATRADLDQLCRGGCQMPDCHHDHSQLFLHARCHIKGKLYASYKAGSGVLEIVCGQCHGPVVRIAVAGARSVDSQLLESLRDLVAVIEDEELMPPSLSYLRNAKDAIAKAAI